MRAVGIIFTNIHDKNLPELVRIRTLGSIPFGGRYRLIDFPLSNMVNSGIDTVGVITKNNYQSLMDHVGSGKDWDLARKDGGLIILPPFGDLGNDSLYTSRLEALKGVTNFLQRADEEYVVMTDCDSVCRMNYNEILDFHIRNRADITLVYKKQVPDTSSEEATTTFTLFENRITALSRNGEFDGETANVFTNVFIMKRSLLLSIVMDSISRGKRHFMTDIIADNLKSMRIFGYEHKGFFAGITSFQAYYDSSMSLLKPENRAELFGDRSVYTKVRDSAPTKYGNGSVVKNSLIADGCIVEGTVENSIIFRGVKVGRDAIVKNSIVMQDTVIGEGATLNCIIVDKNVSIKDRRVLSGAEDHPFYIGKGMMI